MSCIFFKYFSSLPNLFMLFAVKLYLPGNFCDDVLHFICHLSYFAERKNPTPKVRGGGPEEQPHVQGVVAVRAQEGRGELLHVQGQEGLYIITSYVIIVPSLGNWNSETL